MSQENTEYFDIFISYNWEVKDKVKLLYNKLTNEYKFKVWIDDNELDNNMLYDQLVEGIKKSTLFLCCVTKKYAESVNCIREINFASESKKKMIVLMFEKLAINELNSVGFIISPLTRFNCFNDSTMLNKWTGPIFDSIIKSINSSLNILPPNSSDSLCKMNDKWDNVLNNKNYQALNFLTKKINIEKGLSDDEKKDKAFLLFKESTLAFSDEKLAEALEKINQAIELVSSEKKYYLNKAKILNYMEKYLESIEASNCALDLDPSSEEAKKLKAHSLNELGNIEYDLEKYNLALIKYNEAIQLSPKNKIFYSNKAGALKNLERYDDAMNAISIALSLDPAYKVALDKKASVLNSMAIQDFKSGKYNQALIRYDEAIRFNPSQKVYYANKADTLIELKRYEDAIKTADLALQLDPEYDFAIERKLIAKTALKKR